MKADMRCEILIPYKLWWTTDVDCDERVFSEYLQRLYASWLEIEVSQRLMSRTQHELRFTLLRLRIPPKSNIKRCQKLPFTKALDR